MSPARFKTRSLKLACALLALTLVAACSSTRLAYRYADWGVIWWVEDYVSLTGAQEARLNRDLNDLRQWHCSEELPRYNSWLAQLGDDVEARRFGDQRIEWHRDRMLAFVPPLLEQAAPLATRLLASLSDAQVAELARNMEADQQEMEQDYLGTDAGEGQAERLAERSERWLGSLNEPQQAIIANWTAQREEPTRVWLQGRRNWQEALLEALEERQQPDFEQRIEQLVINFEQARGERYQAMMEQNRDTIATLMQSLVQAADERHLDHLEERARELQDDFRALSC